MAYGKKEGIGAVFWVTFIIFGLLVLIGIFYWMVVKPNPVPHSPARPNGALFSNPLITPAPVLALESPQPNHVPTWEYPAQSS